MRNKTISLLICSLLIVSTVITATKKEEVNAKENYTGVASCLAEGIKIGLSSIEYGTEESEEVTKKALDISVVKAENIERNEYLINLSYGDNTYTQEPMELSAYDRELAEKIVMAEAGGEGFKGQALVAQCIRDTMILKEMRTVEEVWKKMSYTDEFNEKPSESVKEAVDYIFSGGCAVNHRVVYFYAPDTVKSRYHEKQNFVLEWGGHRFFDEW